MKKSVSTTSANKIAKKYSKSGSIWSTPYLPANQNKLLENFFKIELQRIIKDIEDSKNSIEIDEKYLNLVYSDDLKLRLRDARVEEMKYSLLHLAAINCRPKLCEYFITELKIDKNLMSKGNLTPMHLLIRSNVIFKTETVNSEKYKLLKETFEILIKHSCHYNSQDEAGFTPLHYAAIKNNYLGAKLLLQLPGIDLDIEDKKNLTPLQLACKNGNEDVAELLIEKLDPNSLFNSLIYEFSNSLPMHLACRHKNEKLTIIKAILEKLKNILDSSFSIFQVLKKEDNNRQTILHLAIENNHLNIVEHLLQNYNFNNELTNASRGNLPIHIAAKNGSLEMLSLLQKYHAVSFDRNTNRENAMHIAASFNRYKFIRQFLFFERALSQEKTEIEMTIMNADEHMTCICLCEEEMIKFGACLKAKDCKQYTPLMTALAASNQKCVNEILGNIDDNEILEDILTARDANENTIYHICAEFNNIESLKFLFQKHYLNDLVFCKNSSEDTILHCAIRNGNLEMVKLILNKLIEYNTSTEAILYSKNKLGQTCFHVGAQRGYFNICEYFLKEKKLLSFVEFLDNNSNSALHLATLNGHTSIVGLLVDHGAETNLKNDENATPLEMSCRKGFFEISKTLLENYQPTGQNDDDCPLHTACFEGAHEVVRVLLNKGSIIDKLNHDNKNCLDVAISRGHREVVRVLLSDPNWAKLIRLNNVYNEDERSESDCENRLDNRTDIVSIKESKQKQQKYIENPQMCALFDIKMWDMLKIILDKCVINDEKNEYDFTIIDPPLKSMSKHPLMLIARSGQEALLRHKTTRLLLHLKWRFIPRFAFYFNLIFYLFYMLLFSMYSVNLLEYGNKHMNQTYTISNHSNSSVNGEYANLKNDIRNTTLFYFLIIFLIMQLSREMFQLVFLDGCNYFFSYQNLIEIFTYLTSVVALVSTNYTVQSAYGSVAVLCAFLLFPLYIQKLKMFGLYVVAFRRTLTNSAKFFPIFLIMFTGFILSFNIRTHFGVKYFNSTDYSIIRALTMVVGELETNKMGLLDSNNSMITLPNYIIYSLFIGLMCIIMLNLFVGIAVGEIKTVLDEADIQQTSLRIMFVLKVQSAVNSLENNILAKKCFAKFLNMNFTSYSPERENTFIKLIGLIQSKYSKIFASNEQQIILSDPQKRLEESFLEMARLTTEQIRSIKFGFSNQISDVESKLSNSQRRLYDFLTEFANNTNEQIEVVKQDAHALNLKMKADLKNWKDTLEVEIDEATKKNSIEFDYTNKYFMSRFAGVEARLITEHQKLQNIAVEASKKAAFQFESAKECIINQSKNIKTMLMRSQEQNDELFKKLEHVVYENTRQSDITLARLCEELNKNFGHKLEEFKLAYEKNLEGENIKTRLSVNECRNELGKKLATFNQCCGNKTAEMNQNIKNNSDFELNEFKVKSNSLEEKINNIELQLNQVMEVITKLNTSIVDLNK